ncbi:MAG: hypothetical protein K2H04_03150, partial [Bacteroidaceae bacterium]|nr:hypothetical protein [Bacteroidaceae bacterium]
SKSESPTPTDRCPRLRLVGVGDIDFGGISRGEKQGAKHEGRSPIYSSNIPVQHTTMQDTLFGFDSPCP